MRYAMFRVAGYATLAGALLTGGATRAQTCPTQGTPPTGDQPVPAETLVDTTYGFPAAFAGIGDFNGDCVDDFIVTASDLARIYFGGQSIDPGNALELLPPLNPDSYGASVAGLGDFNGDGLPDVAVGQAGGEVSMYFGSADSNSYIDAIFGEYILGEGFGWSIAGGDVNGDGLAGMMVGAPFYSDGINGNSKGRVYVYYGKANPWYEDPDVVLEGSGSWDRFGSSLAFLGDFDGDGYGDFAVGAPGGDEVSVFFGSASGVGGARLDLSVGSLGGEVVAGGDANGDGLADVLIGGSDAAALYQEASMYAGRANAQSLGQLTMPDWVLSWGDYWEEFGESVALEDVDGDGVDEAIVGSPGYSFNGGDQTWAGQVTLWRFGATEPYASYEGQPYGDQLGRRVAALGDINYDGIDDFAAAATTVQELHLYHGAQHCLADLNGDGFVDLVDVGIMSAALQTQDPRGDLNGDGVVNLVDVGIFAEHYNQGC